MKCLTCKVLLDNKIHRCKDESLNAFNKRKYCSRVCFKNRKDSKITIICKTCCKEILRKKSHALRNSDKYCSIQCKYVGFKGRKASEETKLKQSVSAKKSSNKGRFKYDENTNNTLNRIIRGINKYKEWRKNIYIKDDYTCVFCNKRGGKLEADHIKPLAKILKDFKITNIIDALKCIELWDLSNGRTLCSECHRKTPTYSRRKLL